MGKTKTNWVVVACFDDREEAKECETLLKINDISASVGEKQDGNKTTFVVKVPEDFVDEAHIVFETQEAYDDMYEFELGEEQTDWPEEEEK